MPLLLSSLFLVLIIIILGLSSPDAWSILALLLHVTLGGLVGALSLVVLPVAWPALTRVGLVASHLVAWRIGHGAVAVVRVL